MAQLIRKVQNFAHSHGLLYTNEKIVIGVSGGPDSVVLLDMLAYLKPKYNLSLHIAHVNYGLRGKASNSDQELVENLAKNYGIPFSIYVGKKMSKSENLENALRRQRYGFFENLRIELGFDSIYVAHTLDDQAETVLMHLLRGAGLQGLAAMRPKTGKICRPLLGITRKEIFQYIQQKSLGYRIDASNQDKKFHRNKIRHELIPHLEQNYNSSIKEVLAKAALSISQDYDYISQSVQQSSFGRFDQEKFEFDVQELNVKHPAIQRGLIREIILKLKGDLNEVQSSNIEEILKIVKSSKGKHQKSAFCGLKISRIGDKVTLSLYK